MGDDRRDRSLGRRHRLPAAEVDLMARMKQLLGDTPYNDRYYWIQGILQSPGVRRKVSQVADRKAAAARSIIRAEKAKVAVTRQDGTRPKGRPYSRISIPAID